MISSTSPPAELELELQQEIGSVANFDRNTTNIIPVFSRTPLGNTPSSTTRLHDEFEEARSRHRIKRFSSDPPTRANRSRHGSVRSKNHIAAPSRTDRKDPRNIPIPTPAVASPPAETPVRGCCWSFCACFISRMWSQVRQRSSRTVALDETPVEAAVPAVELLRIAEDMQEKTNVPHERTASSFPSSRSAPIDGLVEKSQQRGD